MTNNRKLLYVKDLWLTHIVIDISKFKTFDDSFQPDNHFIELAVGTRTKGVALKRGDAEICRVNMDVLRLPINMSTPQMNLCEWEQPKQ